MAIVQHSIDLYAADNSDFLIMWWWSAVSVGVAIAGPRLAERLLLKLKCVVL